MRDPVRARYDALWEEAVPEVRAGRIHLDPLAFAGDERRGLTLLARPDAAVADAIEGFLAELRALEPDQRYQPRADFHVTVLSLFTATQAYAPHFARESEYRRVVQDAVRGAEPFNVEARGVTLSRGAVLVQGFAFGEELEALRERLRAGLAAAGLDATLDERYRLTTAHLTVVRFAAPLRESARFVDALATARARDFGRWTVRRLDLVLGDWYQSEINGRLVDSHALATGKSY